MLIKSSNNDALVRLTQALRGLPGVGPRSAQRMVYHLLQHDRQLASTLSTALHEAVDKVHPCYCCNNFTEDQICRICQDNTRDAHLLCVVETPADQLMIEQTLTFKGHYFVLMGRLSPLDGIGPHELHLDKLIARATDGHIREVILATNFTSEGEATAHYLGEILKQRGLSVTRIARGIPVGGELEYVDVGTVARAILDRRDG